MDDAGRVMRGILSTSTGFIVFLGTFTSGCNTSERPALERCRSLLGTPIVEWPGGNLAILFPLVSGIAAAAAMWWFLGIPDLLKRR